MSHKKKRPQIRKSINNWRNRRKYRYHPSRKHIKTMIIIFIILISSGAGILALLINQELGEMTKKGVSSKEKDTKQDLPVGVEEANVDVKSIGSTFEDVSLYGIDVEIFADFIHYINGKQ